MKRRWIFLLVIGAAPLAAHADWAPAVYNDTYVVTVGASVNGSRSSAWSSISGRSTR